jgi:hypothetical protein
MATRALAFRAGVLKLSSLPDVYCSLNHAFPVEELPNHWAARASRPPRSVTPSISSPARLLVLSPAHAIAQRIVDPKVYQKIIGGLLAKPRSHRVWVRFSVPAPHVEPATGKGERRCLCMICCL